MDNIVLKWAKYWVSNESGQLFVATERNAKLRYEGYKKLSEM